MNGNITRVHHAQLTQHEGVLFFQGRPFTGLAYRFQDHVLQEVSQISAGHVSGLSDDLLLADKDYLRVEYPGLEVDEEVAGTLAEYFFFHGKDFIGILYEFYDSGILYREELYNPCSSWSREWYESGQPEYDSSAQAHRYAWYENGQLKDHNYFNETDPIFLTSYDENGGLNFFSLDKGFDLDTMPVLPRSVSFRLDLGLRGVTDEVAMKLLTSLNTVNLLKLDIGYTNITESGLNALPLNALRRLSLGENDHLTLLTARLYKKQHPQCAVSFDTHSVPPAPRVDHAALEEKQNRLLFGGQPFSGYAYAFNSDGTLLRILDVEDGLPMGEAKDLLRPLDAVLHVYSHRLRRSADPLSGEERVLLDGADFTGVAYAFDETGNLLSERGFDPAMPQFRQWYPSGQIKIDETNLEEYMSWYDNGQMQEHRRLESGVPFLSLEVYWTGELSKIYLARKPDALAWNEIKYYEVARELHLLGQGIDDEFCEQWLKWVDPDSAFKSQQVEDIEHQLILEHTAVTDAQLLSLSFRATEELVLKDNRLISLEAATQVKRRFPNCAVIFNGERVGG